MKNYKQYQISYFFAVFFGILFIVSFRYFDKEAAALFIVFALIAFGAAVINSKLNR